MSRKKSTIDDFFSKRLRALIDNIGVSQVVFSKNIGISQSYLSAVLKGKRGASAELIAGLYIYYSEYMYWLLTGEGEMTKTPEMEGMVAEDPPIYKEEKQDIDEPDHELKNKLIKTQDELIDQLKNRLAETEEKLKLSEEIAVRIREDDTAAQRICFRFSTQKDRRQPM